MLSNEERQIIKMYLHISNKDRLKMIDILKNIKANEVDQNVYTDIQRLIIKLAEMSDDEFKIISIQLDFFE